MIRPINTHDDFIAVPESIKAMVPKNQNEPSWIDSYYVDFKRRLLSLFGYDFRALPCSLAFQFVGEKNQNQGQAGEAIEDPDLINSISRESLERYISVFDLRRLDSYSKNMVDFHLVMDLVPILAKLFFCQTDLPKGAVNLSQTQSAILIGMGL